MTDGTMADGILKTLPLHQLHRELGARMAGFAGYEMPIQYPMGLRAEHLHTRAHAGLFDVSHMGQLRVTGPQLHSALESALPVDFTDWPAPASRAPASRAPASQALASQAPASASGGQIQASGGLGAGIGLQRYSYLLNDAGGIEDDLMLVNLGDEVRIIVNAGNRDADLARLRALCPGLQFEWIDAALLALQGPAAESVLSALDPRAAQLRFMQSTTLELLGVACFSTRSGYTGEDGYEISVPSAAALSIARKLLSDERVKPIGLGARDTLRLEAGLPLHGNDISQTTTPVEAALQFAIPKSRRAAGVKAGGFPGSAVVLEQLAQGASRKLVGLISDEAIPIRSHAAIVNAQGQVVGEVTSGTVSPSLGKPVMLAYLHRSALNMGAQSGAVTETVTVAGTVAAAGTVAVTAAGLHAVVRDKRPLVKVIALPFVAKRYQR